MKQGEDDHCIAFTYLTKLTKLFDLILLVIMMSTIIVIALCIDS